MHLFDVMIGAVSDRDDFLTWVRTTLREAEIAIHNGDADPRRAIWSRNEPVSVFGAIKNARGHPDSVMITLSGFERRLTVGDQTRSARAGLLPYFAMTWRML